ncbi:hypothetical protein M0805_001326 [Coniferiporia weirii]|nr:hypothetical protein M0805_001326 [Coniferiporia weirii]
MPAEALSSESAPLVDIASSERIDTRGFGLTAVEGAQEIIDAIKARKSVKRLILGDNSLVDDGCKELFRFLGTEGGRRHEIVTISLNQNGISDNGLEAIAEYLVGNVHLKELYLRDNEIQGDEALALKFSSAINASSLEQLSLVSNPELSVPFFITFFTHLDPPALRELFISDSGMTHESGPALASFLTSRRSRALETLGCKNRLDQLTVCSLFLGICESNFTLQDLEIDHLSSESVSDDEDEDEFETLGGSITSLGHFLWRNKMLRWKTHREALILLSCSRALSLHPSELPLHKSLQDPESPRGSTQPGLQTGSVSPVPASPFPFHALPIELQQHVLAFLTPTLSAAQRHRVFKSAASPATLRLFFPRLGMESWLLAPPEKCECESDERTGADGSVERCRHCACERWLEEVGCVRFEPAEGLTEADVLQLLRFK